MPSLELCFPYPSGEERHLSIPSVFPFAPSFAQQEECSRNGHQLWFHYCTALKGLHPAPATSLPSEPPSTQSRGSPSVRPSLSLPSQSTYSLHTLEAVHPNTGSNYWFEFQLDCGALATGSHLILWFPLSALLTQRGRGNVLREIYCGKGLLSHLAVRILGHRDCTFAPCITIIVWNTDPTIFLF